jgi:hypothetical protein
MYDVEAVEARVRFLRVYFPSALATLKLEEGDDVVYCLGNNVVRVLTGQGSIAECTTEYVRSVLTRVLKWEPVETTEQSLFKKGFDTLAPLSLYRVFLRDTSEWMAALACR